MSCSSSVSAVIDSPFIKYERLVKTIDLMKKEFEMRKRNESDFLYELETTFVTIRVYLKEIISDIIYLPFDSVRYVRTIELPFHWRQETDSIKTCVFVKHSNECDLTEQALIQTEREFRQKLESVNASDYVQQIIAICEPKPIIANKNRFANQNQNQYQNNHQTHDLRKNFDRFLIDSRIKLLPSFVLKLWIDNEKLPTFIDLSDDDCKSVLESKLNETFVYLTASEHKIDIKIAVLKQSTERIAQNILTVNRQLNAVFDNNIVLLQIKIYEDEHDFPVTFYEDWKIPNRFSTTFITYYYDFSDDSDTNVRNYESNYHYDSDHYIEHHNDDDNDEDDDDDNE